MKVASFFDGVRMLFVSSEVGPVFYDLLLGTERYFYVTYGKLKLSTPIELPPVENMK